MLLVDEGGRRMNDYWMRYNCMCKKNNWKIRMTRDCNNILMYCVNCETEIKAVVSGITYLA
jgi:predicted SprT family Zn-dependent metalloprotease